MNKTFKINPGDEIVITVSGKPRQAAPAALKPARQAPLIETRRRRDILPRRLHSGGEINFYDLGQTRDGAGVWRTNQFSYVPDIDWNIGDRVGGTPEAIPAAQIGAFQSAIIIAGAANFKNIFRRCSTRSDLRRFPITASGSNFAHASTDAADASWTATGSLKLTAAEMNRLDSIDTSFASPIFAPCAVSLINFRDETKFRFTRRFDYAAEAAAFAPRGGDNWYLMPQIAFREGLSQETAQINYHLNLDYKIRERYWDEAADPDTDGYSVDAIRRMTANPPLRVFKTNRSVSPGTVEVWTLDFPETGAFVRYESRPQEIFGGFTDYLDYEGVLAAVVEQQGGNRFYCWRVAPV